MKVISKILLLLIAIVLAIGGVMIYAKTKVDPPVALKQVNQYILNLSNSYKDLAKANDINKEDSIFFSLIDRISIFTNDKKIENKEAVASLKGCTSCYCPLFINRCFIKFSNPVWSNSDHNIMLNRIVELKKITIVEKTSLLPSSTIDSLNLICNIISDYRQARKISRSTSFSSISNAKSIISQAKMYSNKNYIKNCTDLRNALSSVKSNIAQSHYNYVSLQVDKLSQYRYFSKSYYEETLIPHVDAITTEYDNNATALYGSKSDVNALWARARGYYDQAMKYYEN